MLQDDESGDYAVATGTARLGWKPKTLVTELASVLVEADLKTVPAQRHRPRSDALHPLGHEQLPYLRLLDGEGLT
ncbi:hypothetical protein [Streptomyces sp. NPDC088350]|uniref:hypothetical protein n=1 Tax=Streptomyces sp. NPDC088350 TaxID=3365854 RepID=UPI0038130D1D